MSFRLNFSRKPEESRPEPILRICYQLSHRELRLILLFTLRQEIIELIFYNFQHVRIQSHPFDLTS